MPTRCSPLALRVRHSAREHTSHLRCLSQRQVAAACRSTWRERRLLVQLLGLLPLLAGTPTGWAGADAASPAPSAGLLDGQRFSGTVGAIGKDEPYNTDALEFAGGYFVSTDCVQYGFGRAPYSAERVGEAIEFRAVTTSPTHGTMTWEGSIRGDEATARYKWRRERWFWTQRGEFWFKGKRDGARPR